MLLSLLNDSPEGLTDSFSQKFASAGVLDALRALDDNVQRGGLAAIDPDDPLARIGMEYDAAGRPARNCYGVFNLAWRAEEHPDWAERVAAEAAQLRAGVKSAHQAPLRFLIWAGMGGSAEDKWMYQAAGLLKRGPRLYLLDSTDPGKLKAILEDIERRHGLSVSATLRATLVVAMAMGRTSCEPVLNLQKMVNLYDRHRIDARPHILCLALEGSRLDAFAREKGYRSVALQLDGQSSTAGRHSGPLTRGSLYPLALARADLRAWIEGACLSDKDVYTAWRLASFLHAQGMAGRDKVTLLLPKHWAGAAVWTKQDFEGSLGKSEELGLKIVPCAKPRLASYRSPKDPGQDRVFLAVKVAGMPGPETAKVALLRRSGYPLAVLSMPRGASLSRYMQFVHYAVFGMAWLRGMNFVTQPGVELYKSIAAGIFGEAEECGGALQTACWKALASSPRQSLFRGALTLHYDRLDLDLETDDKDAPQIYAAILRRLAADRRIEYGELTHFGDTRYSAAGVRVRRALERAGEDLFERRLNMPADVYEGPAMNHSYHEMIIGHGRCFSTVLLSERQEQLAAARYAPDYHVAQFLATQIALAERGRPVVAITLKDLEEPSLRALEEFFHRAAASVKPGRF